MKSEFACPACESKSWKKIQTFRFEANEHQNPRSLWGSRIKTTLYKLYWVVTLILWPGVRNVNVAARDLNAHACLRRRVLFEIWFPGEKVVELKSLLCIHCGFMAYQPRPEETDMVNKYRFLTQNELAQEAPERFTPLETFLEASRAKNVFENVRDWSENKAGKVLDFGGGNGSMLMPFLERGRECFVVDFYKGQLPGVKKIANEWSDLPKGLKFDVILCNHVLEHVADPLGLLRKLRTILNDDGVVYAEVPLEIWGGIPLEKEPVTHINFYTLESFMNMFRLAQFDVLHGQAQPRTIAFSTKEVAWVVAKRDHGKSFVLSSPVGQRTWKYLVPSRWLSLQRLFRIYVFPRFLNPLRARKDRKSPDAHRP